MDDMSRGAGAAVGSGGVLSGICRSNQFADPCKFPIKFSGAPYLLAIALGTGSQLLPNVLMLMRTTGGEVIELKQDQLLKEQRVHVANAREQVSAIKLHLGLSMSDIADALQVKRPTVYQWLSGSEPRQANLKRLHKLYGVAREWSGLNDKTPGRYLRVPIINGKSLIDLLSEDDLDSEAISRILLEINGKISFDLAQLEKPSIASRLMQRGYQRPLKEEQAESIRASGALVSDREE